MNKFVRFIVGFGICFIVLSVMGVILYDIGMLLSSLPMGFLIAAIIVALGVGLGYSIEPAPSASLTDE